jgi:hypothetical protein
MPGTGIQNIPLRFPREAPPWFVGWMQGFVRDVLVNLDVRNSLEGLGISVSGTPDVPATISASEDLGELFDADFALAEANPLLPNARVLAGGDGIAVADAGPGGTLTVGVPANGLELEKLQQITPLSVLGNDAGSAADVTRIASSADDTVLRRVAGALEFGQLTAAMAPNDLWPYAKLDTGVQGSLDLADSAQQPGTIVKLQGFTVGTLPAGVVGDRAYVTDALTPTYGAAAVGGGAVVVPVFRNATTWVTA